MNDNTKDMNTSSSAAENLVYLPYHAEDMLGIVEHKVEPAELLREAIQTIEHFAAQCKTPEEIKAFGNLLKPIYSILDNAIKEAPKNFSHPYYRQKYADLMFPIFKKFLEVREEKELKIYPAAFGGINLNTLYFQLTQALHYIVDYMDTAGKDYANLQEDIMIAKNTIDKCIVLKRRSDLAAAQKQRVKAATAVVKKSDTPMHWKQELIEWMERSSDIEFVRSEIEVNDNLREWVDGMFGLDNPGFVVQEFTHNTIRVRRIS